MHWFGIAVAVVVGLIVGCVLGSRLIGKMLQPKLQEQAKQHAGDLNLLLHTYRREIARWLFRTDPDRFIAHYARAIKLEAQIAVTVRGEQRRQLAAIVEKFPLYSDFDTIGGWEYVQYADALKDQGFEEVAENYLTIIRFQALKAALDPNFGRVKSTSHHLLEMMKEYAQRLKNSRFHQRMSEAMRFYHTFRSGQSEPVVKYENTTFTVQCVHDNHSVALIYGIHFKDTEEFGLYSIFDREDGSTYQTCYRADAKFERGEWLIDHVAE